MNNIDWHQRADSTPLTVHNITNGKKETPSNGEKVTKYSPRDGRLLYEFDSTDTATVNRAVANAKEAFNDGRWSALSVYDRRLVLLKLADLIEDHKEQFALYECLDVGKPITNALQGDVVSAQIALRNSAEYAEKILSSTGFDGMN